MNGKINLSVREGIASITFGHPKSNALPAALLTKLSRTLTEAGENPAIKVIHLQSEGTKTFCAGASFDELLNISTAAEGKRFFMGFAHVIQAMRKCPKFILVSVQGKAVGGGVGIASAADYCLASETASIKLSELSIGIGPFVIEPAVTRKIGPSAVAQLSLTPTTWQPAVWAKNKGLYHEVFTTPEAMLEQSHQMARELTQYSTTAMSEIKTMLWSGTEHWDQTLEERAQISGQLVLSQKCQEALLKFKKVRKN
ncbi:enoyl-CoA hydratase [Reichenbachiella sp. 5M10]|uniref:enoyl-CoA hydratase/isomerase family protein n=1 Tax=Reichenbachiella sp. 5M10 TaxID=1889772 RepID=UPI000C14ED2B|nr:enoyl-CoA hydratase/isomerase family protein [Reichenbachiella sp. 5M10]PIB36127.1 enoyl-CoA hydratase [Reichenbachiella sp. 5M10]